MRASLWMRAAYWGFYAAIGCFWPYIALYYRRLGLSGPELGLVSAIPALATAFLAPGWGVLSDRFGIHRFILRSALVAAAVVALLLRQATGFATVLPLVILLALVAAPIPSLMDSYGVRVSEQAGVAFGQVRVWGSIGYTVTAWLLGWLMGGSVSSLFLAGYAGALLFTCAATFGLPSMNVRASKQVWRGAAQVVRRPAVLVLLVTVYLISSSTSSMFNFFGIFLTELGASMGLIGTANSLAAISELPALIFGGWLLARLGARRMLMLALCVYIVRMVSYTLLPSPRWVLLVQLSHGLSFGIYLMASVTLVHQLVGEELAATAQGLLASSFSFGQITGSLAGGALLDRIGVIGIYRVSAVVMLLALVVFLAGLKLLGGQDPGAYAALESPTS